MKFGSILDGILSRFSSIDIIIEPEESAVREAVNKLMGGDSKYFDGVKKIVVEHGSPKSPYLGKATGEGIVYISLDAIKNQLESQGLKDDQQAFVNELLKTLGHEVAHIRGGMEQTESPSEVEEQVLEQRFPTPALEKSAADLTENQKRAIQLRKEIAGLQVELNQIHTVWKQLSKSEGTPNPGREAHFKSKQDQLSADIAARRTELQAVESSPAVEAIPDRPESPVTSPTGQPVAKVDDADKYRALFESLSGNLSDVLSGLVRLQQILSNAPTFVRGEIGVLAGLRKATSSIDTMHKKITSRVQEAGRSPHLFSRLALERLFEDASESLIGVSEFLTSDADFVRPLTNQGVELEFYSGAVEPIAISVLNAIKDASNKIGAEHKVLLQIPEVSTVPARQSPAAISRKAPAVKQHGERNLATIHNDYVEEYKELGGKLGAARQLLRATVDQDKLAPLISNKISLEGDLSASKELSQSTSKELGDLIGRSPSKENVARQKELGEAHRSLKDKVESLTLSLNDVKKEISSLYNTGSVSQDDLIKAIAPYSSVSTLESRLSTVKEKLEQFRALEELKVELTTKREELTKRQVGAESDSPEVNDLSRLVSEILPKRISNLEAELGATSSPRPRESDAEKVRIRKTLKDNMSLIKSPLVRSMFEKIMPDVITGGALRAKKRDLERKLTMRIKDIAPETDYQEMKGILPADVEISTWQSQIGDIGSAVATRQSGEMLAFLGRLGQAMNALIQMAAREGRTGDMPDDMLGPNLRLKNYDHDAGNAKIIRDLISVVNANFKVPKLLSDEFNKLQEIHDKNESAEESDPDISDRLKAKRKLISEQPAYQKLRSDILLTIDRLVQHTGPVSIGPPSASAPKTIPARGLKQELWTWPLSKHKQVDREREEKQIAKEFGWRTELPKEEIESAEDLNAKLRQAPRDEQGRPTPAWQGQQWGVAKPLGREGLEGATSRDIALGLTDVRSIPKAVRKMLLDQLHTNSKEMRDIKDKLANPDLRARAPELIDRARELHSEVGKIRDLLEDPSKYLFDVPGLEKELGALLEKQDSFLAKKVGLETDLLSMADELSKASGDEAQAVRAKMAPLQKSLADTESALINLETRISKVEIDLKSAQKAMSKFVPEERRKGQEGGTESKQTRVYEPTEEDRAKSREHRERHELAVERGLEEKSKRYSEADRAVRSAMYRRRNFIDPTNPTKHLPSTKLLDVSRAMRYAYKKAMELSPAHETSRESRVRAALYKQTELDNYIRMVDDEYLAKATERAESESQDPREQYLLRSKYLSEMHNSTEYRTAIQMLQQAMNDLDEASVIDRPEGVAALEGVAEERDMGRGVGKVRPRPERMLGAKDPLMLFFRAQYESEVALMRYEEAAKAKKHLDSVRAKARAKAADAGMTEQQIDETVDREYEELLQAIMAAQYKHLSNFDNIVESLKGSVQGKQPSTFFDPTKVQTYLDELIKKQAAVVREKELARRFVQVRETPLVTGASFDPDRYPKFMAVEFSNELPTVSEFARQLSGGEGVYKKLRYIIPHLLWGSEKPQKKGKKGDPVPTPAEPLSERESPLTETVKHKFHPAPIKPGGKGQRGENVPQFMQSKSRK